MALQAKLEGLNRRRGPLLDRLWKRYREATCRRDREATLRQVRDHEAAIYRAAIRTQATRDSRVYR